MLKKQKYANFLKPDKIFILSALHYLLNLNKVIEPYNVTLSYISPSKRTSGLIILNAKEKIEWGNKVISQLKKVSNLEKDKFILLAGQEYIKPLRKYLNNIKEPLKGLSQGKRLKYLNDKLK